MAPRRAATLWPGNGSARGLYLMPWGMTRMPGLTAEQVACMERIALDIFADMSNAGRPLREALAAIYLSGIAHGLGAKAETESDA